MLLYKLGPTLGHLGIERGYAVLLGGFEDRPRLDLTKRMPGYLETGRCSGGHDHVGAFSGEPHRDGEADAPRRADDGRRLAC